MLRTTRLWMPGPWILRDEPSSLVVHHLYVPGWTIRTVPVNFQTKLLLGVLLTYFLN